MNPIIATSPDSKIAAFIFIKHLFSITWNESRQDYRLSIQLIDELFGDDFKVDLLYIFQRSFDNIIVIVSKYSTIFVYSDKVLNEPVNEHILEYFTLPFLLVDKVFESLEQSIGFNQELSRMNKDQWNLIGSWKSKESKIVSITDTENEDIAVLVENGIVYYIDTIMDFTLDIIVFIRQKWLLMLALNMVVLLFTLNE
jgi:hypothetical protein